MVSSKKFKNRKQKALPPAYNWRTTDDDEIAKRRERAREELFRTTNATPEHPIFSNFRVKSESGLTYSVEIRDIRARQFACECVDFRINGLGTCKHVEAVLLQLNKRHKSLFKTAQETGSKRIEVVVDHSRSGLQVLNGHVEWPRELKKWFDGAGRFRGDALEEFQRAIESLKNCDSRELRISQEVEPWLEARKRANESIQLRREYELKVQQGEWPPQETKVPLFPYQREGMLHLAFTERALLADEMGLGKTIQAIAACALLHRLGKATRALVVTPASLKTEWEEQIRKFTDLDQQVVFGSKLARLKAYTGSVPFFTIVNYEQMVADTLDVNTRLKPDVVVLDEAQRIKNWNTKTAQAIKRLRSRYAFVLTGTPIENRIDELHSLIDFLNPSVLGPLFRFNREFYELDDRGRPVGLRNLDLLHERIRPLMLRRRKAEVETELPERTDRNHFVKLSELQKQNYATHEQQVMKLVMIANRRPLSIQEQERLQRELAILRMICDSNYILDREDRACPKMDELERLLEECEENGSKVIVFSEWERMLDLARDLCRRKKIGFAWHTGTVPQPKRRAEINAFKNDPGCRVFLSTDSGATGLNLQNASVVINCDLPWNPAKLEQRIARAWRKNQTRPVTVINLISEDTIEHRMLQTLAMKQAVAESVLDKPGEVKEMKLGGGREAFLKRLKQLLTPPEISAEAQAKNAQLKRKQSILSTDPSLALAEEIQQQLGDNLLRCEERFPDAGEHSVLVVVVDNRVPEWREKLRKAKESLFAVNNPDASRSLQLEVIDRATDEAIQRLIEAGLIARTTRAARPFFPLEHQVQQTPLSTDELARVKMHREIAGRKLKLANVLSGSGFADEARPALLEAAYALARAYSVETRLPEPSHIDASLQAPLSRIWGEDLPLISGFLRNPQGAIEPIIRMLEKLLARDVSSNGALTTSLAQPPSHS